MIKKRGLGEPVNILLVEDNPADIRLTAELLKRAKMLNHLEVAEDGEEALAYLYQQNGHANAPRPDLILLDLNLPRMTGAEVLAQIKRDPHLKRIPVVILTASKAEQDVARSYDLCANAYVIKPINLDQFVEVVKSIEDFWLAIVRFPPSD